MKGGNLKTYVSLRQLAEGYPFDCQYFENPDS